MSHRPRISADTIESLNQLVESDLDLDPKHVDTDEKIQTLIGKYKQAVDENRNLRIQLQHQKRESETASSGGEQTEYHPPSDGFMEGV